jgi:hypothetical protein
MSGTISNRTEKHHTGGMGPSEALRTAARSQWRFFLNSTREMQLDEFALAASRLALRLHAPSLSGTNTPPVAV